MSATTDKEKLCREIAERHELGDTPSAGSEQCPTCGSNERDIRGIGHGPDSPKPWTMTKWTTCDICGDQLCPDLWHSAESGKEGETTLRCNNPHHFHADGSPAPHEIGPSCMAEPLTPFPAQGADCKNNPCARPDHIHPQLRYYGEEYVTLERARNYAAHVTAQKDIELTEIKDHYRITCECRDQDKVWREQAEAQVEQLKRALPDAILACTMWILRGIELGAVEWRFGLEDIARRIAALTPETDGGGK